MATSTPISRPQLLNPAALEEQGKEEHFGLAVFFSRNPHMEEGEA